MRIQVRDRRVPPFTWHPNHLFDHGHVARMGDGFVIYAAILRLSVGDVGKPTLDNLATVCGTKVAVIQQRLARLVKLGYIAQSRDPGEGKVAIYRIIEPTHPVDEDAAIEPSATAMTNLFETFVCEKPDRTKLEDRTDKHSLRINYFRNAWKQRYPGSEYFWQFGKHDRVIKAVFTGCGEDEAKFKAVVDAYFKSTDDFVLKEGHSIEMLQGKLNKFLAACRVVKPPVSANQPTKFYL